MAIVFEHDFEDNSLASWETNDGSASPTIQTGIVYEGTRALRSLISSSSCRLIKNITGTPTCTHRARVRRASVEAETLVFQSLHSADFTRGLYLQYWGSSTIRVVGSTSFVDTNLGTPSGLAIDAWEDLQLGLDASANPWIVRVWRDGSLILDTTYAGPAFNVEKATIGAWVYTATAWDVYHDKVQIANTLGLISDVEKQTYYGYRRRSYR